MPWTHVRHRVEDYNTWKEVYDGLSELKMRYGWKRYRIFQVAGDRNDLLVMDEFESVEQARSFLESKDLKNALRLGGVVGAPETALLQGLEEGRP
ncbi:MAG: cyclase [Chloroflexota bacterium]|nr:cyclase [Chloroflexota bacterium]MDQ5866625.1 cyclase [Chloroflexota bacterium]